ncbi:MAG: toxin-antitoxin system HicB family antitoxin [Symploca sp. SIO1B1]|nr:toxin-antitoxin system HicB family antitoxin [Symploca sp. SIO1B1]
MKKSPATTVITFRIERKLAARLNKKAVAEHLSLNQYVRSIFIEALVQQDVRDDLTEIHHEVQDLTADVDGLRHDIALMLSVLLTELAEWSEEEAQRWILAHLGGYAPSLDDDNEHL